MFKKSVRAISLMIALLLVVSVFGACSKDNKPSSDDVSTTAGTTSETTNGTTNEATTQADANAGPGVFDGIKAKTDGIDFQGKTIVVSTWDPNGVPQAGKSEVQDKVVKRIEKAEKKYNAKIEWKVVEAEKYPVEIVNASAAGIKFADIIYSPTVWSYPTWVKKGLFAPLDEYIDYTHPIYKKQDNLTKFIDGKHYALCEPDSGPRVVVYNTDILTKAGCEDPLTLAQDGKWNWDTFLEIAQKTTLDSNQDGKVDQFGVGCNVLDAILESNGVQKVKLDNNKLVFGLTDPQAIKALNFFGDLAAKHKVLDKNIQADLWQNFRKGIVAMQLGYHWEVKFNIVDRGSDVPFKVVPVPLGPDVTTWSVIQDNILYQSFSPLSEYPISDLLVLFTDMTATDDKSDPETYIDPFEKYKKQNQEVDKVLKTDEEVEFYWDTWQNAQMYFSPTGGTDATQAGGIIWLNIMAPLQDGKDASTQVNQYKNQIQAALDQFMK